VGEFLYNENRKEEEEEEEEEGKKAKEKKTHPIALRLMHLLG
jgi:hypothetical protein